ncbi:hypothetical protein CEXT_609181 [Caerostris extrusa]|uniref:Maturase K n=1 Tax=Caerostris extrusa TaxID=172846 RepID=A0AAV4P2B8_CAEEX|nr:hypothetical protein CEXT_609181 [Caerostris extrusa]
MDEAWHFLFRDYTFENSYPFHPTFPSPTTLRFEFRKLKKHLMLRSWFPITLLNYPGGRVFLGISLIDDPVSLSLSAM